MAASATKLGEYVIPGGNGKRVEYGIITYDTDATVEVPTGLSKIEGASFVRAATGGAVDVPSIDETVTNNRIAVSGSAFTVDIAVASTDSWLYQVIGW